MYVSDLGTDWTVLARDEALHRAFALGVAAACGHHHPDEYNRVVAAVDSAYERSMVELAYSEGRQKANDLRSDATGAEAIWKQLVDEDDQSALSAAVDRTRPPARLDLPASLSRIGLLDRSTPDQRESLSLPSFLRRD
ncbi:hypothetical protein [Halogranum rubrum]|uniref:Uncharacterized protein n=1 Tax=Halogranum salarium B-1 TaxID=1210908 RepID=J3JGQ7_9EURY|nr:hypothetical protein [Halogranum salarium]EJN60306.1 hypothetical protein HSB1_09090 [Halogranum salarium B-1]